jgi:hypothetical protein
MAVWIGDRWGTRRSSRSCGHCRRVSACGSSGRPRPRRSATHAGSRASPSPRSSRTYRAYSGQKSSATGTRCSSRAPFRRTTIVPVARSRSPNDNPNTPWRPCTGDQSPIRCPHRHSSVNNARSRHERAAAISATATSGSIPRGTRRGTRARSSARRPCLGGSRPGTDRLAAIGETLPAQDSPAPEGLRPGRHQPRTRRTPTARSNDG